MSMRDLAIVITIAVAVIVLGAMVLAWRRRLRRDAGIAVPLGVPEHAEVTARHPILYVATTRHDHPLERLALPPLAYRARGELTVTDRGLALCLDGTPTVFLATRALVNVDRATVAIDRAVEPGGLVRVVWRVDEQTLVDSYLRFTAADPASVLPDLQRLLAAPESGAAS